jgi:hypothetical protein
MARTKTERTVIAASNGSWWNHLSASDAGKRIIVVGEFTGQMKSLPTEWICDHHTLGQKQASHTLPSSKIPGKNSQEKLLIKRPWARTNTPIL